MFLYILFYIFMLMSIIEVLHFGMYIVGANYYDIKKFKKDKSPKRRTHRVVPTVSVLIPAHNEELGIIRCLESVRKNTYRKLQIIVIDDFSTDNTRQLVRDYIAKYPHRDINLLYKRSNVGKAAALNHALRTAATGELVMTLDADSVLAKDTIKNAVKYFDDPAVVGVAANVRIIETKNFLGMLQRFEYLVGYRSKKFYSITNSEYIVGGVASTYRYDVLKKVRFYDDDVQTEDIGLSLKVISQGNRENRLVYGADVLAMTEGVQSFTALLRQRYRWKMGSLQSLLKNRQLLANGSKRYSRMLTFYRIPMAFFGELILVFEPLALAFVIYASVKIMSPALFISAYVTISLYILWNVWPDEHASLYNKARLSLYVPFLYFAFYTMNVVQFIAMVRCIFNHKQVRRLTKSGNNWVSPERSGQAVQYT